MERKNQLSIRAAVMNGLARCAESKAPLCCLGEFLEQLVSLGWDAEDILSVERSILVVLGHVKEKSLENGAGKENTVPVVRADAASSSHS